MSNNDKDSDKSKAIADEIRKAFSLEDERKTIAENNEKKLKILREKVANELGTTR